MCLIGASRSQGSLVACQAIAEQRQLSYKYHSTAQELNQRYPLNAKEGYQGLFEDGAGSINVSMPAINMMSKCLLPQGV